MVNGLVFTASLLTRALCRVMGKLPPTRGAAALFSLLVMSARTDGAREVVMRAAARACATEGVGPGPRSGAVSAERNTACRAAPRSAAAHIASSRVAILDADRTPFSSGSSAFVMPSYLRAHRPEPGHDHIRRQR